MVNALRPSQPSAPVVAIAPKPALAPAPKAERPASPELKSGFKKGCCEGPCAHAAGGKAAKPELANAIAAQRSLAHANGARGVVHTHDHGHRHAANEGEAKKPIVISGTDKDDVITVKNAKDGGLDVSINGKVKHVAKEDADRVVIRAKGGDDKVTVDASVTRDLRIEGGAGKDTIQGGAGNDLILGGDGDDVIDGGAGNDTLHGQAGDDEIMGGAGRDIIHGHAGNDVIDAGAGQDYVDGGAGNDKIAGGAGNDTLIGGKGDDTVDGGKGDDTIAGSSGKDTLIAGEGKNTIYHEAGDAEVRAGASDTKTAVEMSGKEPGSSITVKGDKDFVDHIDSDLEAMRSTPQGRKLLAEMDSTLAKKNAARAEGEEPMTVTIQQGEKLQSSYTKDAIGTIEDGKIKAGKGSSSTITFDPTQTRLYGLDSGWNWAPTSISLGHELIHSLHSAKGTQLPPGEFSEQRGVGRYGASATAENEERRTVGLDWTVWTNDDPTSKRASLAKKEVTENSLRRDLGLEERTAY